MAHELLALLELAVLFVTIGLWADEDEDLD
jgi:hypothetical protein